MTIYQLMYLAEAARCGSISQAANNLNVSQPTLSESIRELEKELSVTVFLRSSKGVTLTQEGRDLLGYAHKILSNVDEMKERFSPGFAHSHLSISMSKIPFAQKAFFDLSQELGGSGGRKSLTLIEKMSPFVLENVITGKSSIGVILVEESGDESWKSYMDGFSIEYNHLITTSPVIVMRSKHPLLEKKEININDIKEYPMIYTYETEECFPNNNEGYYSYDLKLFPQLIYVYNQSTVYDMVSQSDSLSIISCPPGLAALGYDFYTMPYSSVNRWNVYWIRRKQHRLTVEETKFIELLEENKYLL